MLLRLRTYVVVVVVVVVLTLTHNSIQSVVAGIKHQEGTSAYTQQE